MLAALFAYFWNDAKETCKVLDMAFVLFWVHQAAQLRLAQCIK
jgi:hypothetical protein